MRRKMGETPAPSPMDEGGEMGGNGGEPAAAPDPGDDNKPTAFLPKEMGGGKVWKPGDEIVLRVDAVDPETGELQVSYATENPGESEEEPTDSMSAMDQKLPDSEEGY